METSKEGMEKIKSEESLRLNAYKCSSGVPTIGYGHTKNVKMGQKITKSEADEYFKEDLKVFENEVNKINKTKGYNLNQNQFDSLVSFAFNTGIGNLRKLTQNRTKSQLPEGMKLYNKGGGKVKRIIPGLDNRRKREVNLFNTPIGNNRPNHSSFIDDDSYTDNLNRMTLNASKSFSQDTINRSNSFSAPKFNRGGAFFYPKKDGFSFAFVCSIF